MSRIAPRATALFLATLAASSPCRGEAPGAAPEQAGGAWADRLYGAEDSPLPIAREVLVEGFDGGAPWRASMAAEDGAAETRLFAGSGAPGGPPSALGLRVGFLRRSSSSLLILAPRPIPVEGECASISLRALGRSFRHFAYVVVLDYYGAARDLPLGRLDFLGWKTLRAYVPPFDPATRSGLVQDDRHFAGQPGLRVAGIRIEFDPVEAYGSFYAYFDEIKAVSRIVLRDSPAPAPPARAPLPAEPAAPPPAPSPAEAPAAEEPPAATPEPAAAAPAARVLARISEAIAAALVYPPAARRRGAEGSLVVAFTVTADGGLASASIAESSGNDILDRAGLELLRSVFPVENDAGTLLSLRVRIAYRLSDGR